MQAITVRQPWAWAIIHAGKDIENRSWTTRFRGALAIHAGMGRDDLDVLPRGVKRPRESEIVYGAIIGVVDLVDVVRKSRSKWYHRGSHGLVLANVRRLKKPIPCKGMLGFWHVPPQVVRAMAAQGLKVKPGGLKSREELR